MLNNFINGNLKEAKRQAIQFSQLAIAKCLRNYYGYSVKKAILTSVYLKNPSQSAYQSACDAK